MIAQGWAPRPALPRLRCSGFGPKTNATAAASGGGLMEVAAEPAEPSAEGGKGGLYAKLR